MVELPYPKNMVHPWSFNHGIFGRENLWRWKYTNSERHLWIQIDFLRRYLSL